MPKVRLGVVLLIPPPLDRELNAFRRALGDGTYGRVPVHLTLVPPVNVNRERLEEALALLRSAAATTAPFSVHLGSPVTFLPANPVLYLPLVGEGRTAVFTLREAVFREPLSRPLSWPYVPHVTLADEVEPDRIRAAEAALDDYEAQVTFGRVHLLQESPGRVWLPVADAAFRTPAVVGRGGLPVELSTVQVLDPEARAFADREASAERLTTGLGEADPEARNLAVVARQDGRIVGTVEGWARAGVALVLELSVAGEVRGEGVEGHLLASFESAALGRGCRRLGARLWSGSLAEAACRDRGWVEECRLKCWYGERDLVHLRRDF